MEASGGYERRLHEALAERGAAAAIVDAKRVRDFARASGRLAETDRLDAAVIARYGAFARPAPTPVPAAARQRLGELPAYRRQLLAEIAARARELGHLRTPDLVERARAALDRLRREKAELDALVAGAVAADPGWRPTPPCCAPRRGSGRSWSPRSWPSCPSWARSTGARSPAWSGWRR